MTLGRNATILIHEATFGDDKQTEAREKKHSTVSEAAQIADAMQAYRLVLTHYSQRYRTFPPIPEEHTTRLVIAFDYMVISFKDLLWAPQYTRPLLLAFPPEEEENDEVTDILDKVHKDFSNLPGAFTQSTNCTAAAIMPMKRKLTLNKVTIYSNAIFISLTSMNFVG